MHIDCESFVIRSWQAEDEQALPRYANNREIWLNLRDRFPYPYTQADAQQWLSYVLNARTETNFALAVDGEAVGGIGLLLHDDIERYTAEIGYWLGQPYWGRGMITNALRVFTDYAIAKFELNRIYAVPFLRNSASIKVLEKVGYHREGILRRSAVKDGQILDQVMYAYTVS